MVQVNAQAEPAYGGRLVFATQEPSILLPPATVSHSTHFSCNSIFSTLVEFDFDFNWKPYLAESWEISSDGLTYTFHLVKNATWHDGEPVTSADVKFSIEEISMQYHSQFATMSAVIDKIETPDDYTVVFKLSEPSAVFKYIFHPRNLPGIAPKHLYEGTDILQNEYNWAPIGCGPFKLKEYVAGDHITLEKNENYFRK
jgi:peptide/nickel transport system substrate-binding protein